jgi:hypothetical protein
VVRDKKLETIKVSIPFTFFFPLRADYRNLLNQTNQMPNKKQLSQESSTFWCLSLGM